MKLFYILFILIIYILACLGIGSLLVRPLLQRLKDVSAGTILSTSFLLGQGLLASIWLGLALAKIFTLTFIILVLLISISCFILFLRQQLPLLVQQIQSIWSDFIKENWIWKVISISATLLCLAWITSLGRSVIGDGSAFYFALPKVIAASHRLIPLPGFEGFMYIGLQGEMHYAALMALGSPDAAQIFDWPTIVAGSILLLALGRIVGLQRRGQWLLFSMIFTSSCVIWLSGDGKTDLFAASLGLGAYYWTTLSWKNKDRFSPWLVGLFAGFAVTAKFSYIPVLLPGIALIICWGYFDEIKNPQTRKMGITNLFITSVKIIVSFLLALTPHMIQNIIFFQNPIAPIGLSTVSQVWFTDETTRRIIFTYPLAVTIGSYWAQYGNLSPLLLAFLPLGLLLPRPHPISKSPLFICTIAALLGLIIWIISQPSVIAPRYFMPTLLLFFLLPSKAVELICQRKHKPWLLYSLVILSIFATFLTIGLYFNNLVFYPETFSKYISGNITLCDRDGEYCNAMERINDDASPGDRVHLASYYRYWFRTDLLQCLTSSSDKIIKSSSDEFWTSILQSGFHYLLVDKSTHSLPYLSELPFWLKLTVLYQGQIVTVYKIDTTNAPVKPLIKCIQQKSGAWDLVNIE